MKFENNIYKLTSDGYAVADKIIEILLWVFIPIIVAP
jgi:hypothetical protein